MMRDELKARIELAALIPLWVFVASVGGIKSGDDDLVGAAICFFVGVVLLNQIIRAWRRV